MTGQSLAGKRIVITRARSQSSALREPLEALGAEVIEVPTIEIRNPDSWSALDGAISRLEEFDFLILTSVNGVEKLLHRLHACGRDVSALAGIEVGAIGPATASELERLGVRVDFVPTEYRAEGLIATLGSRDLQGKRVLIPRAKVARDLVPRVLTARGARVEVVEAYQTALPDLPSELLDRLRERTPDIVTFTSSSTATNFARLIKAHNLMASAAVKAASIGPVTSETAEQLGFEMAVEAGESTMAGLVKAIASHFAHTDS